MLLVKPVTVSRGFRDIDAEEQERLTTDLQTETRVFFGLHCTLSTASEILIMDVIPYP